MNDFLETTYDKFAFRVKKGYLYSRDDFWVKQDGNVAVVGVTDFLQKTKGDVAFLETVEVGTRAERGRELGQIETIKASFPVVAPVSGRVIEVNNALEASPHLINDDPYDAGWIYRIELDGPAVDEATLVDSEDYFEIMRRKIAEEMEKK